MSAGAAQREGDGLTAQVSKTHCAQKEGQPYGPHHRGRNTQSGVLAFTSSRSKWTSTKDG